MHLQGMREKFDNEDFLAAIANAREFTPLVDEVSDELNGRIDEILDALTRDDVLFLTYRQLGHPWSLGQFHFAYAEDLQRIENGGQVAPKLIRNGLLHPPESAARRDYRLTEDGTRLVNLLGLTIEEVV
jgi:hypothetical protein